MRLRPVLCLTAALMFATLSLSAQNKGEDTDSLVTLVSAKSASLLERNGQSFRRVMGPARFLHNKTYLLCDSALWNVSSNIIYANGHVQIIQDRTKLTSETLEYVVDEDLAKFRGYLVQLEDKDHNTLRTRYLDYNTKDSIAIFQDGASMRDKDGQIIESRFGSYDSKASTFTFMDNVNMFTDSIFVKTSRLEYNSESSTAYFAYGTDAWDHDNMLSADDGWYDRTNDLFFFRQNVHVMTDDYEGWSDTLYYHRPINEVEMLGRAELMDTTRNVYALAGRLEYRDTISRIKMTRDPAVMSISEENGQIDTVYLGADTLIYQAIKKCDIPEAYEKDAKKRLSDISGDPVAEYRRKAAEEARKAAEEAAKNDPNRPPEQPPVKESPAKKPAEKKQEITPPPVADSLAVSDSLAVKDSLAVEPEPVDTTKFGFITAVGNVKLYRRDIQFACDSLAYNDLDSLARLYREPFIFHEGNRQYSADSIYVVLKNREVQKANLMSNAFIVIEEQDSLLYDQIRGAEMVAYFDSTRTLKRFDALGGAAALFYLEENGALATVNKVESKMLYALFSEGTIDQIYYFDSAKNDAYPIVQLPKDESFLKGYVWKPELRPNGREDITTLVPRKSQRKTYLSRPRARFPHTAKYFPGYIDKVHKEIARRDSLDAVRARERRERERLEAEFAAMDTLKFDRDTVVLDSIGVKVDSLAGIVLDTLSIPQPTDSLSTPSDSISIAQPKDTTTIAAKPNNANPPKPLTPEQIKAKEKAEAAARKAAEKAKKEAEKAKRKAEKEAKAKAKQEALEAKWAEEDRIYAEKQEAKKQKALEKERARKLKELRKRARKSEKEYNRLMKYVEKYRARLRRKDR